jgi:ankyrin repeat protein
VLKQNINDGVNINAAKGRDGETALHRAATRGKLEAAKLLIEKGADPNIGRTKDGDTPLDLASQRGHTKIADLLRKHGGKTAKELKAKGK